MGVGEAWRAGHEQSSAGTPGDGAGTEEPLNDIIGLHKMKQVQTVLCPRRRLQDSIPVPPTGRPNGHGLLAPGYGVE